MIAVGALLHVLPEQAAHWAYPQATMSDEEIVFTMCTGLAGRLYQSGLIDRMNHDQRALVAAGVAAHKDDPAARSPARRRGSRPACRAGTTRGSPSPSMPATETFVLAWRQEHAAPEVTLELPHLGASDVTVTQVYPPPETLPEWNAVRTPTGLTLKVGDTVAAARMLRLQRD